MKIIYSLLLLFLSSIAYAQPDLDFQTTSGGWTAGSLSKSYTGIGTPAVNVSVLVAGVTSGFSAGSPQAFSRGLQFGVDHTNNTNCVTGTITFSPAVQGLTFRLLNVDRAAGTGPIYGFVDQVTVTGQNNGATVATTISASGTAGTYSSIAGNVVTGTGDAPSSGSDPGNVVTFAGAVSQITIAYCNNTAQTQANPGQQTITIEDLSWSGVLPVGLVSFRAVALATGVALSWATAWELNNHSFEVQRSADAREFVPLGRVAAGQQGGQTYSFIDPAPLMGTNYYRLKQTDADAAQTSTYSPLISFSADDTTPILRMLGNPATGDQLSLICRHIDPESLMLCAATGRQIPFSIRQESATNVVLVPKSRLVPGLYLLSGRQGANRLVTKVVVRE